MKRRLDSRSIEQFVAVATSLSFRQAAESLHISQPPLSRAIREMEERLGARLFLRDTRGVALTEAGKRLLPLASRVLRLMDEAEAAVAHADEPSQLRVGFTSAVEPGWFSALASRLGTARPGLSVVSVSDSSPRLVRALRNHRLDAAFIALPTEAQGLHVTPLERQRMVLGIAASHPLARKRAIGLVELGREPVFLFERARQPAFFDHCQRVFARHGYTPNVVKEPTDHHVLLSGVASGRAVALLPESFMSLKRAGVRYRALKEGDELGVGIGLAVPAASSVFRALLLACAKAATDD